MTRRRWTTATEGRTRPVRRARWPGSRAGRRRAGAVAASLAAVLLASVAMSCQDDPSGIDFEADDYQPIPAIEALDYGAIHPAADWDYWELRAGGWWEEPQILGSGGTLTRDELDPDVRAALDATLPPTGFSQSCPPAFCYRFIAAVDDGEISVIDTVDGLAAFLGPIDSAEEAILRVLARGYTHADQGEHTGVRAAVDGGWDVVVLELVELCAPIRTDRVRFRVGPEGRVQERAREVWSRDEHACI